MIILFVRLCISNERYLENKLTKTPKGSFYLYKDGRCGVVNLRSIRSKICRCWYKGINLGRRLPRSDERHKGGMRSGLSRLCRRAAIGYDPSCRQDQDCYCQSVPLADLQERLASRRGWLTTAKRVPSAWMREALSLWSRTARKSYITAMADTEKHYILVER